MLETQLRHTVIGITTFAGFYHASATNVHDLMQPFCFLQAGQRQTCLKIELGVSLANASSQTGVGHVHADVQRKLASGRGGCLALATPP